MHVIIKKENSVKEIEQIIQNQHFTFPKAGSTKKYYGALKRGFDGLEYQKKLRNEWQ